MVSRSRPALLGTIALVVLGALTACIPGDAPGTPNSAQAPVDPASLPPECGKANMAVKAPGKLIIATPDPAPAPWFVDNKPENGKGFESAVAVALAQRLGFATTDLIWKRVAPDKATTPGLKEFDLAIGQFLITDSAKGAVEFSGPYYNVRPAIIALQPSKIANAKNFGDLMGIKLGAQSNTNSAETLSTVLGSNVTTQSYATLDEGKKALQDGAVDGLVVALPEAFALTAQIKNSKIVGQLPLAVAKPDQFAMIMEHGAPANNCLSRTIEALRATKILDQLEQEWLTVNVPNLA